MSKPSILHFVLLTMVIFSLSHAASAVTVTLDVSAATPLSGNWSAGDLVEVVITAFSDGGAGKGFAGADFNSSVQNPDFGISVNTSYLKIHDVKYTRPSREPVQVDTYSDAWNFDDMYGYYMSQDTWVYDEFSDFTGPVVMAADGSRFQANAGADLYYGYNLGTAAAINFIHLVLEIQPGFVAGMDAAVSFKGQVGAYPGGQSINSVVFGSAGGEVGMGSFVVTNIPEPATLAMLVLGSVICRIRRR